MTVTMTGIASVPDAWSRVDGGDCSVFIVDDDSGMCAALSSLIRSIGLKVQAFESAWDFLHHERPPGPACLVLDMRMPGLSGLDLQGELARTGEELPIIFISGHADIPIVVNAMKAGAVEFLTKPFREQALLDAIRHALERNRIAVQERERRAVLEKRYATLTSREREVLAGIIAGKLNKQVAGELGLSEITIKVHRRHVMQKMRATSLANLVQMIDRLS